MRLDAVEDDLDPQPPRRVPSVIWWALALLVGVAFAAAVMVLGRPPVVDGRRTDPAAVASQPPVDPPDKGIVVN